MVSLEEDTKGTPLQARTRWNPPVGVESFIFSPGLRSVAAMAGWDEESIIIASLTVEDTPEREQSNGSKQHKRRLNSNTKTPPSSNSRRKRRVCDRKPLPVLTPIANLDTDGGRMEVREPEPQIKKIEKGDGQEKENQSKTEVMHREEIMNDTIEVKDEKLEKCSSSSALPCMEKLREELSCSICLEICFEPSTTSCGHSFCKKCLRSAADKCGKKCPKCRQLISNGRSCTVNTVLWNTIQLLFPKEVEERKGSDSSEATKKKIEASKGRWRGTVDQTRMRSLEALGIRSRSTRYNVYRRSLILDDDQDSVEALSPPSQDDDAELALRIQREEFMGAFQGSNERRRRNSSVSIASANLRAMASRAIRIMGEGNNARMTRSRLRNRNFDS